MDLNVSGDPEAPESIALVKCEDGEWIQYTVNITEGEYDVMVRGSGVPGRHMEIQVDGQKVGSVALPGGSWEQYETVLVKGVKLPGGEHKLRLQFSGRYSNNLNWIEFVKAGEGKAKAAAPKGAPAAKAEAAGEKAKSK